MSKNIVNIDDFDTEDKALWHQLDDIETPLPSPEMKANFYEMLDQFQSQEKLTKKENIWNKLAALITPKSSLRVAYTMALMAITGFVGYQLANSNGSHADDTVKVTELSNEVHEMKEMMMLAMLQNPQATERIKAVSYTKELVNVDEKVIAALITTFRDDENDNVRMVALNALIKQAHKPKVRETLIEALMVEKSPLIQVALADAMLKLQEKKSLPQLKQRLKESQLNQFVKEKFSKTIDKLST
jgi:ATP-dependent Lon protease